MSRKYTYIYTSSTAPTIMFPRNATSNESMASEGVMVEIEKKIKINLILAKLDWYCSCYLKAMVL